MGVQDRDWWQEAQREREHKEDRKANLARAYTIRPTRTSRIGTIWIILFWSVAMSFLYWGSKRILAPKPLTISIAGDLSIPRSRDGHFTAQGTINGLPVNFLIDTGASYVTVSESFSRSAGLPQGQRTVFQTANGPISGRVVSDAVVAIGPVTVSGIKVGVGLVGARTEDALLGQNFLSEFRITIAKDELILSRL